MADRFLVAAGDAVFAVDIDQGAWADRDRDAHRLQDTAEVAPGCGLDVAASVTPEGRPLLVAPKRR